MLSLSNKNQVLSENLINNSIEAIVVCTSSGVIFYANKKAELLFNCSATQLIGTSIANWFEDKEVIKNIINAVKFNETKQKKIKLLNANGTAFIARVRVNYFNETGMENSIGFYISDQSKRIEFEKNLLAKINSLEDLSKSRYIRDGKLEKAIFEILSEGAKVLNVARANAWLIDADMGKIQCIGHFPFNEKQQNTLYKKDMPEYFKLITRDEIVVTNDSLKDKSTQELVDIYIKPNNIGAMIDVPIRIAGDMIGVLCFEHVNEKRKWNLIEKKFGLFIAQLISLALETDEKQKIRKELEQTVAEKELLLQEMNHRIKNNMMIVSGILLLQSEKAKDSYHKDLFTESSNKLQAVSRIHELLYKTQNYSDVNMKDYLTDLSHEIVNSFSTEKGNINISIDVKPIMLNTSQSIICGLIVSELLTNSYKHAFINSTSKENEICVSFNKIDDQYWLKVCDNGKGFDFYNNDLNNKLGVALVKDLVKQLNGSIAYSNAKKSVFEIYFK